MTHPLARPGDGRWGVTHVFLPHPPARPGEGCWGVSPPCPAQSVVLEKYPLIFAAPPCSARWGVLGGDPPPLARPGGGC